MSRARIVVAGCAIVVTGGLAAAIALNGTAESDDRGSRPVTDPRRPPRATVGGIFLPRGATETLVKIRGLGRFRVLCRRDQALRGVFISTSLDTQSVTIDRDGMPPASTFVDPGKRVKLPAAAGTTTTQRWQFTDITEASSAVAIAFIASVPEQRVGGNGCEVSAYAFGPTDSRAGG